MHNALLYSNDNINIAFVIDFCEIKYSLRPLI